MSEERVMELLTGVDGKLSNISNKHDAISIHLDRIENKITKIEGDLNSTTKTTHDNTKEIEFLKTIVTKNEAIIKDEFDVVWKSGIHKCQQSIKEHEDSSEKRSDKIRADAVKDIKLWLFGGTGALIIIIGKIIYDVIFK